MAGERCRKKNRIRPIRSRCRIALARFLPTGPLRLRERRAAYSAAGQRRDFSSFREFHRDFNASRRFRAPAYRRPTGWYDHRWSFGEFLPRTYWVRDYWLDDFAAYGLPPPPYGAVWVRVGSDALLVDEDSGEVITVEYSVFY